MNNKVKKRKYRSWKAWALAQPMNQRKLYQVFCKGKLIPNHWKNHVFPVVITEVRPLNNKVEG